MSGKSKLEQLRLTTTNKKALTLALVFIFVLSTATTLNFINLAFSADPVFSIAWISDTQHSSAYYPSDFDTQCSWIVNNSAALNIKAVIHTGDIVDASTDSLQWTNANHSMGLLLDNNIPYCWDAGNHDKSGASWNGNDYTTFNMSIARGKQYWVTDYYNGKNTAIRLNFSSMNILIVNVEYQADVAAMQWANNLLESNPSSNVIVGTHDYLDPTCNYDQWAAYFKANVLDPHPNVFLALSGHSNSPTGNRTKVGNRNELLFDRQEEDSQRGGASIRLLAFNTATNTINVTTYLPYQNEFLTDPDSQFILTNAIPSPTSAPSPTPAPTPMPTPTPTPPYTFDFNWSLVNDGRDVKAYPDLKEYIWQKNATLPPNGPYDKIGLHRLVKTGITPKAVLFLLPGGPWANAEEFLSNPPQDNWTVYENYSLPIYLARRDFEVYSIDYRTHFAPTGVSMNASQLNFMLDWGWNQWISDIKEAVNKAKEVSGAKKIFLTGVGALGGEAAMDYASLYWKEDLRGLILLGGKTPVAAKPVGQTNTYNLTTQITSMATTKNYASPMWTIQIALFAFRYALQNPNAPAQYPPGIPLPPPRNPITNRTWTNITEWAAYMIQYMGSLSNISGGYGNVTRDLQLFSKNDQWYPNRIAAESIAISDWTNCPYVTCDFDELYSEINVPLLAFNTGLTSNRTGTFQFVNGIKNPDFTGTMLPNYGELDMLVGDYAARDVFVPTHNWMISHMPSPFTTSVTQSQTTVTAGNIVSLYVSVSGGVAPYTYQWYQGTSPVGTNAQLSFYPNTAGTYTYYCKITDAEGTTTNSNTAPLTVNSPQKLTQAPTQTLNSTPTPTFTPTPEVTPTITPTQTPNPTLTPAPTPSPSPTSSESPSPKPANTATLNLPAEATYAIATLAIIIVIAAAALMLKKRTK